MASVSQRADAVPARASADGRTAGGIAGRIGPNAIIQVIAALDERIGRQRCAGILRDAGLPADGGVASGEMVDERAVISLHARVRERLEPDVAEAVLRDAGVRTGDYILAHRIPRPAQSLLRLLPRPTAARLLLLAIRRHGWTFAGSGTVSICGGRHISLAIRDNPLCRDLHDAKPGCVYYAATIERLFARLVDRRAAVGETACEAAGDAACRFVIMPRGGVPARMEVRTFTR